MIRSTFVVLAWAVVPLPLLGVQGAGEEIRCDYASRQYCDENGCRSLPDDGAYLLIPDWRELQTAGSREELGEPPVQVRRCDGSGCTPVSVTSSRSGIFLNVWKLDGGYMLKFVTVSPDLMEANAGQFVEVATSGLGTFISYGSCPQ